MFGGRTPVAGVWGRGVASGGSSSGGEKAGREDRCSALNLRLTFRGFCAILADRRLIEAWVGTTGPVRQLGMKDDGRVSAGRRGGAV